jgi:hypothetical protein
MNRLFILRHRSVCWLISFAFVALLILLVFQGAMKFPPFAAAVIWPGAILFYLVVAPVGWLGALPWVEEWLGLEGPSMLIALVLPMAILFWWALALSLLLWRRRRLIATEARAR